MYFEGRDDNSMNAFTHLAFSFIGNFCRSCLAAINENDGSYWAWIYFFQVLNQCSVIVDDETGGTYRGQEGSGLDLAQADTYLLFSPVEWWFLLYLHFFSSRRSSLIWRWGLFCAEKEKAVAVLSAGRSKVFTGERCFADPLLVVNERNVTQVSEFLL